MTEAESEREGRRGREGERKESERLIWRCYPAGFEDGGRAHEPRNTGGF